MPRSIPALSYVQEMVSTRKIDSNISEKVPLKKVKFNAKLEHAYIDNWKVLQDAFKKLHIEKV